MTDPRVVRLLISGRPKTLEILSAELFDAGAGGLVEEPGALVVYPADEQERELFLAVIERVRGATTDTTVEVAEQPLAVDWQAAWQKELRPQKVSRTFTLRPSHCPLEETDDESATLWFEPEASFGSGDHPTTQLAAGWIEEFCRRHPSLRLFDVGTGTGVLSLVAVRSGAQSALAVDIDEVAVRSAERNIALNDEEARVQVARGSADFTSETFPLVLANINTPILLQLAAHLSARVAPDGLLLLTGLLLEDVRDVESAFIPHGLGIQERSASGDWALLILKR